MTVAAVDVTVRAVLDKATARLADAGIPSPRVNAEWLLAGIVGWGRARLLAALGAPLGATAARAYAAAVERRVAREPLQQILGWEDFRGVRVRVMQFDAADLMPGGTVRARELAWLAPPYAVDNLEGLAAGKGARGETLLWLMSDDNFNPVQRNILVMFELAP